MARDVVGLESTKIVTSGLRERKKAKQWALIAQVANEMFVRDGFDAVTLNQVADACEISVRTIIRYFDSKDALGIAYEQNALERFQAGLAAREGSVTAYWRCHVSEIVAEMAANADWYRSRRAMIFATPALKVRWDGVFAQYQRLIADAIMEETDGKDRLGPQLMAAMLVVGAQVGSTDWAGGRSKKLEPQAFLDVIDYAEDLFSTRLVFIRRAG